MKQHKTKLLSLFSMLSSFLFLNSCAQIPRDEAGFTIIVRPSKMTLPSGSENNTCVTLLDKDSSPLFGLKIKALSTSPDVATVTHESITDATGKAFFTIHGVSPGNLHPLSFPLPDKRQNCGLSPLTVNFLTQKYEDLKLAFYQGRNLIEYIQFFHRH